MNGTTMVNDDRKRIYWVGGSKGGVGKTMMTLAMIDYVLENQRKVLLVEADTSNPDVWKAYRDLIASERVDLDNGDGWIQLVNLCDRHRDSVVIINTPARNSTAAARFGGVLDQALEEVGPMVVLWVINRQRDSVELLREFMEAIPHASVHVVRNGYFGDEHKFELYNASKIRELVEGRGGKSVTFPNLADRVADDIYTQRLALSAAAKSLPIGNRAELSRWRGEVRKVLGALAV